VQSAVARILESLRELGGLQGKDIANMTDASPATVSRWSKGTATPSLDTQAFFAQLRYVVERLIDFYTPAEARLWLYAPHPLLDNERAVDVIRSGRGRDVLAVIESLDAGDYL
jgi:uncharacterized protein (DUF2384 family)